jgi:hypothetical protein
MKITIQKITTSPYNDKKTGESKTRYGILGTDGTWYTCWDHPIAATWTEGIEIDHPVKDGVWNNKPQHTIQLPKEPGRYGSTPAVDTSKDHDEMKSQLSQIMKEVLEVKHTLELMLAAPCNCEVRGASVKKEKKDESIPF